MVMMTGDISEMCLHAVCGVALVGLSGRIDLAFIFGSLAVGRQKYSSDVDLMIIGDISLLEAVKALASAQVKLGREINPVGKFDPATVPSDFKPL